MSADKITCYFFQNGCQADRPVITQVNSLILLNIAEHCLCCRSLALHDCQQLLKIVSSILEARQQLLSEVIWTHLFKNAWAFGAATWFPSEFGRDIIIHHPHQHRHHLLVCIHYLSLSQNTENKNLLKDSFCSAESLLALFHHHCSFFSFFSEVLSF